MKMKKIAVAMAIMAGLSFAGGGHLKPAFAGHWEEVPFTYDGDWPVPPELLSQYEQSVSQYIQGTSTIDSTSYWNGTSHHGTLNKDWTDPTWQEPGTVFNLWKEML